MKWIIYWSFWAWHSIPCPQQNEFDKIYGVGVYDCAVAHGEMNKVDTSVFYYNKEAAYSFYKQKMIQYYEQEVTVWDGQTGEVSCRMLFFPWTIDNVRIDSIKDYLNVMYVK